MNDQIQVTRLSPDIVVSKEDNEVEMAVTRGAISLTLSASPEFDVTAG